MRIAVFGAVVASLVVVALGVQAQPNVGLAQRPSSPPAVVSNQLITLTAQVGDNRQQLTVIDPALRVMSVYHIELASGIITLKSVRNIHWDLQMVEFNGTAPLPGEIRSQMEQR